MEPATRVILWSAPRCGSSAFERSVRELSEVKVLYEPHQAPYYSPERKNDSSLSEAMRKKYAIQTYDYADERLLADYSDYSAVFAKNMAYFIDRERFPNYVEGKFSTFKHTFLIRNPRKSIPSAWKARINSGISTSSSEPAAYPRLHELFKFVQSKGRHVILIDLEDLVNNPEHTMEQYCRESGLPYDKKMLTWSPGIVEDWTEFEYYKEWHWNAMYSSGFDKDIQKAPDDHECLLSTTVEEEIQVAMPYYEDMHKHRMV